MDINYPKGKPPKKHYVYTHRTTDGKVFYVGKGSKRRAWDCLVRSDQWFSIAKRGYIIHIVADGLTKKEAFNLEKVIIKVYKELGSLINKKGS